jgi:hypothetical protein
MKAKPYSFTRAINSLVTRHALLEPEAEVDALYQRLVERDNQLSLLRGSILPNCFSFFAPVVNPYRSRVLTAAADSGIVVQEGIEPVSSLLAWSSALEQGAILLTGLTGDVSGGITTALTGASWQSELTAPPVADPLFSKLSLTPKRVSAALDVSSQLLSSAPDSEQLLVNDLGKSLSRALDRSVYHGNGGNSPVGIANHPDSIKILHGASWWDDICSLERQTAEADVGLLYQSLAINPAGRETLRKNVRGTATIPVWSEVSPKMVCTNAIQGLQVFGGCWDSCVIGVWMLEIIVNPFTKAERGLVQLVGNLYADIGFRYGNAFGMIS